MKKLRWMIRVNLKNIFQSPALVIVYFGTALLSTIVIGLIGYVSVMKPAIESGYATSEMLSYMLGVIGYCTAFIVTGICYSTLFSTPLMRDKIHGNIESLLATPTSVKLVWFAKTIALFIPGFVMGIAFSLGLMTIINVFYLSPDYEFMFNPWIMACTYLVLPLVFFALSLLMNLVGLIGRAMDGGVIGIIFVSGVPILVINLLARNITNGNSWPFLVVNLALAGVLLVVSRICRGMLQTERVVLSCRK